MGRRLPPGEAERRAAERSRKFWSGQTHRKYNPVTEGYGSAAEWMATAEQAAKGRGSVNRISGSRSDPVRDAHLATMGLDDMPRTARELVLAFRRMAFKVHPDITGIQDTKPMRDLMEAYSALLKFYD